MNDICILIGQKYLLSKQQVQHLDGTTSHVVMIVRSNLKNKLIATVAVNVQER
jgi:hypothetical protein